MKKNILLLSLLFIFSVSLRAQNLALSATPTHSGGGTGGFAATNYNDNVISTGTFGWVTAPSAASYIQYDWGSTNKTFSKVKIFNNESTNRTLTGGIIQRWDAGTSAFVNVYTFSVSPALVYEVSFPAVTTTRLRIANLITQGAQATNPAVNEIQVTLGAPYDISPAAVVTPSYACGEASVPFTVSITNNGANSMTAFNITAQMSGAMSGTFTRTAFSRTIAVGATDTVIFTILNTSSITGVVHFKAFTSHTLDTFRMNDTLNTSLNFIGTPSTPVFTHPGSTCGSAPAKLYTSRVANTGTVWYPTASSAQVLSFSDTLTTGPLYNPSTTYYAAKARYDANSSMGVAQGTSSLGAGYRPMFDLKAGNTPIVLDSISFFNATAATSCNYSVYYKVGTYVGSQTNASAWTLNRQVSGQSLNSTGENKLFTGGIVIQPGQTFGIYLYLENVGLYLTTGFIQWSNPDLTLLNTGATISGATPFATLYSSAYQFTGKLYYRKVCLSGITATSITMNPKPKSDVVPDTKFQGMNNGGLQTTPDIVGSKDTVIYQLNPPAGFSNAGFGSSWIISDLKFTTSAGFAPGSSDTMTTFPTPTSNGTIRFIPSLAYEDSVMILKITLMNLSTGCDSVITRYIYVAPKPIANFHVTSLCFGSETKFQDLTFIKSGVLSYEWSFGDPANSISAEQFPGFNFPAAGSYTVTMKVTSHLGYSSSVQKNITILYTPVANFTFNNVCFGKTTKFVNTSTVGGGNSMTYLWDFGAGGATSTTTSPTNTYAAVDNYHVKLTAYSGLCSSAVTREVYVFPLPVASYTGGLSCSGLNIPFTNTSAIATGHLGYKWTFGDGSAISTEASPSHRYDVTSTYHVKLVTYSEFGCIDSVTKTITVSARPTASFTAPNACIGSMVNFSNSSSVAGGGTLTSQWNFGDGVSQTNNNATFTHSYFNVGKYNAWLVTTTAQGCKDSVKKEIEVGAMPAVNFGMNGSSCAGIAMNFTDMSISSGTLTYDWDFASAGSSTQQNPSFSFASAGNYNVKLTITSTANCVNSLTRQVTVHANPDAAFSTNITNPSNREVSFAPADMNLDFYNWEMGDGQTFQQISPTYSYTSNGPFTTKLTARSKYGCESVQTSTVFFTVSAGNIQASQNGWSVYPNPLAQSSAVKLNLDKKGYVKAYLTDGIGRLISILAEGDFAAGSYSFEIGSDRLARGSYHLVMEKDGVKQSRLLIKY